MALDNLYPLRKPRPPPSAPLFQGDQVRVTRRELMVGDQHYPLTEIHSAALKTRRAVRPVPVGLLILGGFGAFVSARFGDYVGFGAMLLLVAAGVGPLLFDKRIAVAELRRFDGTSVRVLESEDHELVGRAVAAVRQALAEF